MSAASQNRRVVRVSELACLVWTCVSLAWLYPWCLVWHLGFLTARVNSRPFSLPMALGRGTKNACSLAQDRSLVRFFFRHFFHFHPLFIRSPSALVQTPGRRPVRHSLCAEQNDLGRVEAHNPSPEQKEASASPRQRQFSDVKRLQAPGAKARPPERRLRSS